ncbi:MAG: 16S rRNA (uracil(1498)-N(3))-methyltransferase [Ideonella sp.]|nr:16S rRNA (uracil(1498)-N(3))-methyltransferase [Ideonella sp.]
MPARFFIDTPLVAGTDLDLPPGAARHAQVLRLQPGAEVVLFDGRGGEYAATVTKMGRSEVGVRVGTQRAVERELAPPVTLAIGMPANERMDTLVEKATELGAAAIVPLHCERSVLRLQGERAHKKQQHWQGVAIAAAEQSGRTRLPQVHAVSSLQAWLGILAPTPGEVRWLLDPGDAMPLAQAMNALAGAAGVVVLSGPEGGLGAAERALALRAGFVAVKLGPRVLRADTAPLAVLACLGACAP